MVEAGVAGVRAGAGVDGTAGRAGRGTGAVAAGGAGVGELGTSTAGGDGGFTDGGGGSFTCGGFGLEDREQLLPGAPAEVFEEVGHLTGTEAAQPVVGGAELDVAGRARRRAERLDRRPVDDLVRRRPGPPPRRAEAAQEGLRADIDANEAKRVVNRGEVEVGRAHDLDTVNIDELVVEHVTDQGHLALAAVEVPKVDAGGLEHDLVGVEFVHLVEGHIRIAPPDAHDQPAHGRVVVLAAPLGDDVGDGADLCPLLVAHRTADEPRHRHQGLTDRLQRQEALIPTFAVVLENAAPGKGRHPGHRSPPGVGPAGAARTGPAVWTGSGPVTRRGERALTERGAATC